ncbi:MAG: hypothetical protein E6J87_14135 [Deltaproteobacteria bacterium]|nr:MAG: hypothetical protein E6J87_14135 [Deltaproteobacteria bacterium]
MVATFLLVAVVSAAPASAEESRGFLRQILIMWFPLLLIIGLWIYFIRQMRGGRQAQVLDRQIAMLDRYIPHMDAMEQKLDRIIEALERRSKD